MKINDKNNKNKIKVDYHIPQIDVGFEGLRSGKENFKKSTIGSPLFGTHVKDTFVYNDISEKINLDVRSNYDAFRSQKKITKAELIEKYGTEFFEFQHIDNQKRKEVYGEDITIENKRREEARKEEDTKPKFAFIKEASEIIGEDNEQEILSEIDLPKFDFGQFKGVPETVDKEEEIDLSFGSFKPKYVEPNPISSGPNTIIVRKEETSVEFPKRVEKPEGFYETRREPVVENKSNFFDNTQGLSSDFKPMESHEYVSPKVESSFELPKVVNPYRDYVLPPRDIFKKGNASNEELPEWVEEKRQIINKTLLDFDIQGEVVKCTKGPCFSRYEVALQSGVNVKKLANLYDTFQMNLGAKTLRIQAPIPGKKTVGIEVPNDKSETVYFGDIITDEFYSDDEPLKIALGKDIDNTSVYSRIDKWPHGLIAGSTGSGKSVCMNTILISLLLRNKPDDVKLMLIDPKTVELISYNDLPHLVTPVINDPELASEALKWACNEMDRRYSFLSQNRVRNIKDYNEKVKTNPTLQKMSYIVIVIDELADLMMVASSDVEASIMRIAQKARAAGIHILVATQRPTVEVIKGNIKTNITTRIAFKVSAQVDSATILGEGGAEALLGKGDMLLKENDIPQRLQGAYIPDSEIDMVTDFIRAEAGPDYLFTHDDLKRNMASVNASGVSSNQESPEMLYNAAEFFISQGTCSINGLQNQFGIGFNRAKNIVKALEEMGIVSAKNGTLGREILVTMDEVRSIFQDGEL